jgi:hypothetical protein
MEMPQNPGQPSRLTLTGLYDKTSPKIEPWHTYFECPGVIAIDEANVAWGHDDRPSCSECALIAEWLVNQKSD